MSALMHRLIALAAVIPGVTFASGYRFSSPVSVQLVNAEVVPCAHPLGGAPDSDEPRPGRCLGVNLAVSFQEADARVKQEGQSYVLEQGFAERIALDFGRYAVVALHQLASGLEAAGLREQAPLASLVERALRQIQRYVHYDVLRNVALPIDIELAVARLAERFFQKSRRPLTITSGPRTPESQAFAMYLKLIQGVSLRSLYRKTEAAQQIRKTYDAGRHARKRHRAIIADMAEVIRQQMNEGIYISPHLKGCAVDIRSRTLNRTAKSALQRAVSSFPGMRLIREEKTPPHFHLEIMAIPW